MEVRSLDPVTRRLAPEGVGSVGHADCTLLTCRTTEQSDSHCGTLLPASEPFHRPMCCLTDLNIPVYNPSNWPGISLSLSLFIVCHPAPPPPYALKDVFGRFGSLIDIYILNGKTCGYAKYACKESAEKAIQVGDGVIVFVAADFLLLL